MEFCTARSAPLAMPIDIKHDKTAKRKPFFLILIKCYQKNFLWGNKKMHQMVHLNFKNYAFGVSGDAILRSMNVMRPLSKSYGVISTRTFFPTLTQIRFLRIFPQTVAMMSWPLSSFTRNIVFGNLSVTVPVKTITSSFAIK